MRFLGIDLSPNHAGFVLLGEDGDEPLDLRYLTNQKGSANQAPGQSYYYKVPDRKSEPDTSVKDIRRLYNHMGVLGSIYNDLAPDYAYQEEYAWSGSGRSYQIGELGGVSKLLLFRRDVRFRTLDVSSVKMFAAHTGNADKDLMIESVQDRWGVDFSRYNKPGRAKDFAQTQEDLTDAYVLARVCRTEYLIRSGHLLPSDLDHDKERAVFLRTTKHQPVNILSRDWICREDP